MNMKIKQIVTLLITACLTLFLWGCNNTDKEASLQQTASNCTHNNTRWIEDIPASIAADGRQHEECVSCKEWLSTSTTGYPLEVIGSCYGTTAVQNMTGNYLFFHERNLGVSSTQVPLLIESCGNDRFYIKDSSGFYVLEYYGGVLKLEEDTGYTEQQWILKRNADGYVLIEHADSPDYYLKSDTDGNLSVVHRSAADDSCLWLFQQSSLLAGCPYVEITGERGIIFLRLEHRVLDIISNQRLQQWANDLEYAYDALADLTGNKPYDRIEVRGYTNCGSWGYVFYGKPVIHINKDALYDDLIKMSKRNNDWNFGALHEMSHLFDCDNWLFDAETLAQYKPGYVLYKYGACAAPAEFDASEVFSYNTLGEAYYRLSGKLEDNRAPIDKPLAAKLFEITDVVGWDAVAYAFHNMPQANGVSQMEIFETFLSLLSNYSGVNVKLLFTEQEWLVLEENLCR